MIAYQHTALAALIVLALFMLGSIGLAIIIGGSYADYREASDLDLHEGASMRSTRNIVEIDQRPDAEIIAINDRSQHRHPTNHNKYVS